MTRDEYRENIAKVWALAGILADLPLGDMLVTVEAAHSLGPILSPSAYQVAAKRLHEDAAAIDALRGAQMRLLNRFPSLTGHTGPGGEVVG